MKLIRIFNNKEDAKKFQDKAIKTLLDIVDALIEG